MAETFRFSPRPNRAHEIAWQPWGEEAFAAAAAADRLVYLDIAVVWCEACNVMDETTLSDPAVAALLRDRVVPIRVDADRLPHVQERYIAGGWPTSAFLTPTGEVLWSATFVDAATLLATADRVLAAWTERRAELELEIERRRRALEAARGRQASFGMVRRDAADEIMAIARETIDLRNGGFHGAPKFPPPPAVELMYARAARGEPDWLPLADLTLDGMLAGELWDRVDGGFYRYALEADWTQPRMEKLLEVNAGLLRAYALGAQLRARPDWRAVAERIVEWVDRTLGLDEGLWAGSQRADDAYFQGDAAARAASRAPALDPTVYTHANAQWIAALAEAGGRLGRSDWVDRASAALDRLLATMSAPDDVMFHFREGNEPPSIPFLLGDTLHTGLAAFSVAQAAGRAEAFAHARRLANGMERAFWAEDGGFNDRSRDADEFGLLRYRDRPFELNAEAARFYCDLAGATGERGFRGCAERVLALLSPAAGRYGVAAAAFAIAADEYFEPASRVFIVPHDEAGAQTQPDATSLRAAALAAPLVALRVHTVPEGTRVGQRALGAGGSAAAFVFQRGSSSAPIRDPAELIDALARGR